MILSIDRQRASRASIHQGLVYMLRKSQIIDLPQTSSVKYFLYIAQLFEPAQLSATQLELAAPGGRWHSSVVGLS